jgi:hypothetical protein
MAGLKRKATSSPHPRRNKRIKLDADSPLPTQRMTRNSSKKSLNPEPSKPRARRQAKTKPLQANSIKTAHVIVRHEDEKVNIIINKRALLEIKNQPENLQDFPAPIQDNDPRNELRRAIDRLSPSSAPLQLIGREEEIKQLTEFLEQGIQAKGSSHSLCKLYCRHVRNARHWQNCKFSLYYHTAAD